MLCILKFDVQILNPMSIFVVQDWKPLIIKRDEEFSG